MGRGIICLADDEYIEWSTIVDAPVSYVVDRKRAVELWGEERVERTTQNGTSYLDVGPMTAAEYIEHNRAGEDESCLTLDEIRKVYKQGGSDESTS